MIQPPLLITQGLTLNADVVAHNLSIRYLFLASCLSRLYLSLGSNWLGSPHHAILTLAYDLLLKHLLEPQSQVQRPTLGRRPQPDALALLSCPVKALAGEEPSDASALVGRVDEEEV